MFNSKKLLTVVFVILLVILLAEIGYLAYSTLQPPKASNAPKVILSQETPASTSSRPENLQAISDETLSNLSVAKKGVITSSVLENKYQGEVTELELEDGLKIIFKGKNGVTNGFYFSEEELDRVSASRFKDGSNEEQISFTDLKIGDQIDVTIVLNLLSDLTDSLVGAKIKVVSQ